MQISFWSMVQHAAEVETDQACFGGNLSAGAGVIRARLRFQAQQGELKRDQVPPLRPIVTISAPIRLRKRRFLSKGQPASRKGCIRYSFGELCGFGGNKDKLSVWAVFALGAGVTSGTWATTGKNGLSHVNFLPLPRTFRRRRRRQKCRCLGPVCWC